ncbi:MAG: ferrous iron transport protein A [Candidatus Thorarchaeota archaeon]|nr:ferrous iron transport protein A [Candidatus Thorarchaeota archaeon]
MDEKGTHTESKNHTRLISVSPGKTCRLVGISNSGRGARGRHRRHEHPERRHMFGRFFKHRGQWDERKKQWRKRGEREIVKRLLDLGLTKGCTFKVIHGQGAGPVLVEVRGTRIALGHGLASKVLVEVLEDTA